MIRKAIANRKKAIADDRHWLRGKNRVLEDAETKLMRAVDAIVGSVSV
jgi:hypothetical protein